MGSGDEVKRMKTMHIRRRNFLILGVSLLVVVGRVFFVDQHGQITMTVTQTTSRLSVDKPFDESTLRGIVPRKFEAWLHGHEVFCQKGFDKVGVMAAARQLPIDNGLLFLKPVKTGSSTTSGVNLRIARNIASRMNQNFTYCNARFNHGQASLQFSKRNKAKSYLWTVIRDPTERAVSMFFHFNVAREKAEPSDINFQRYLLPKSRNYYLATLSMSGYVDDWKKNPSNLNITALPVAQSIIDDYNFIGITERLDESLVAMQMLLNLPTEDLLYLKAKSSGGYDDGAWEGRCYYITPKFVSQGMKEWFAGDVWQNAIRHDLAIYSAAARSLDLTIKQLGPDFQTKLAAFKQAQDIALSSCQDVAVFPCLATGEKATKADGLDCLWQDSGCGTGCLDAVASQL